MMIYAKTLVQVNALNSNRTMSPDDWASFVHQELQNKGGNLSCLTDLASHYLSHLVIACKLSLLGVMNRISVCPSQKSWWEEDASGYHTSHSES